MLDATQDIRKKILHLNINILDLLTWCENLLLEVMSSTSYIHVKYVIVKSFNLLFSFSLTKEIEKKLSSHGCLFFFFWISKIKLLCLRALILLFFALPLNIKGYLYSSTSTVYNIFILHQLRNIRTTMSK